MILPETKSPLGHSSVTPLFIAIQTDRTRLDEHAPLPGVAAETKDSNDNDLAPDLWGSVGKKKQLNPLVSQKDSGE